MGDRYLNIADANTNANANANSKNRSIREPASQIHEVVSPMAEHGKAWTTSHDRSSIWYIDETTYTVMQCYRSYLIRTSTILTHL